MSAHAEHALRCDIVEVGRRLYARGLIGGGEGNVSVRLDDALLVTPAGVCKGFLTPEMIVRTDLEGRPVDGGRASTETRMHTAVYRRRPDARAVVHAHPPTATGFAVAGIPLDRPVIAEAVVTLGPVPIVPYGQPATGDLAEHVAAAICASHALLMANHGALTVGETLYRAWERMETLEQLARVTLVTRVLGQDRLLPPRAVEELMAARAAAGYPPPACAIDAGTPVAAASFGTAPSSTVTLSQAELVRIISEAVERFGRIARTRSTTPQRHREHRDGERRERTCARSGEEATEGTDAREDDRLTPEQAPRVRVGRRGGGESGLSARRTARRQHG